MVTPEMPRFKISRLSSRHFGREKNDMKSNNVISIMRLCSSVLWCYQSLVFIDGRVGVVRIFIKMKVDNDCISARETLQKRNIYLIECQEMITI